jgi:hypothetical protein
MTDYMQLYGELEAGFKSMLSEARDSFSPAEQDEILAFVDAREYGLALETLVRILVEERKPVSPSVLRRIDNAAELMELKDEHFMRDLHACFDHHPR